MFITHNAGETAAAGSRCAATAAVGDVFALTGDLGAGKTQFVKGFVAGLDCTAEVTSPTFTLLHEYAGGRLAVYHFDWYRLDSPEGALRLGLDEYLFGDGACIIEWADRFPQLIPENARWISIRVKGETEREIAGLATT